MFVDRQRELHKIHSLLEQPRSLSLLYGKRRVGKTRLLKEALRRHPHVYFLARAGSSEENLQDLLGDFKNQLPNTLFRPLDKIESWSVFFTLLTSHVRERKRLILVLDEFQYLVEAQRQLPSLIQRFWDQLDERDVAHLFLCGSSLGVMSSLGQVRQPLYGRFSWQHELQPFDYRDAARFVPSWPAPDQFRAYGAFGGLARHLELIDPDSNFDSEVVRHILDPMGTLHHAVQQTLQAEQVRDPGAYTSVLSAIGRGRTRPAQIQDLTALTPGSLNNALKGLQALDMVERRVPFGEKPTTTRSLYRLKDPFLLWHARFVDPLRSLLAKTDPAKIYKKMVKPYLADYMGRLFETISRQFLERFGSDLLGEPVRQLSSYWSRDGTIEIDLMGRAGNVLLVGECKWREEKPVGMDVLGDLKRKFSLTGQREWLKNARYLIACSAGFTKELQEAPHVLLVGPSDLLH